jgi:hypothetical protein
MSSKRELLSIITHSLGLYGTSPTCYLSALARYPEFRIEQLKQAFEVDRSLVRVRAMRRSVYMLGHDLLPIVLAAMRDTVLKSFGAMSRYLDADYDALSKDVETLLAGTQLPSSEIRAKIDPDKKLGSGFQVLIGRMASECRIVRAVTTGSWRSGRLKYALWSDWLPEIDPWRMNTSDAQCKLADLYASAYGPVDMADLQWWTGWTRRETTAAAADVDLNRDGTALELVDGLRLLPVWDILLVAYRNRDRLLSPDLLPFVYDKMGNATSVVLDRGKAVGIWDLGKTDDPLRIRVAPFGKWTKARWKNVQIEADRIGRLIDARTVEIIHCEALVNLHEAPRNRFLSPLSDQ